MLAGLNSRAVEVIYEGCDENGHFWEVGSGSFVRPNLVLTASHCIPGPGKLRVRLLYDGKKYPATVRLQADKDNADLAVLEVSNVPVEVPVLRFGEVNRNISGKVKECIAIGFPRFKDIEDKSKVLRCSAQVEGEIPTGENFRQPILTLQITNKNPRSLPDNKSEWAGISGAVVYSSNDTIIGVITEHHLPEGESALNVVPITAIDGLDEAGKWWQLLGVNRQALVSLPKIIGNVTGKLATGKYINQIVIKEPSVEALVKQMDFLEQKEESFDLFLSYLHLDDEFVDKLSWLLENIAYLRVLHDRWIILPEKWQQEIPRGFELTKSCAICIGGETPEGWFRDEIELAISHQSEDKAFRVIPVLLPNAQEISLDDFPELRTLVDFRNGLEDTKELHRLVSGIRGVPPGRKPSEIVIQEPDIEPDINRARKQLRIIEQLSFEFKAIFSQKLVDESVRKIVKVNVLMKNR